MIKQKHQKDIHFWSKFFWWLGFLQSSLSQVIVERSRFKPVTFMHTEVLEATSSWSLAIRDWVLSDVEDKNFHEHLPYMYIYICIHVVLLFLQRELEDSGFLCASGFAIWRDISKKNSFNQAT